VTDSRPSAGRLTWLLAVLLATVALWNGRDVLAFDFVARDDDINIYFNPHLGPPSAASLGWMFTDVAYMRRYVPLGWLAFSGVYQFSGLSPVGYHAANLGLHVANTLLVYALLLALCRRYAPGTEPRWQAGATAVGAALWSLHPFRAETIGWSSGLLYGAAGCWALLSALAYLRMHAAAPASPARRRWLAAAALGYTLSILTYPVAIALALVFVVIDRVPPPVETAGARPSWRRLAVEKLAFLVPGATIVAVTVAGRFEVSSFWPRPPSWDDFTFAQRLAQAGAFWAYYVWKTAWPAGLTLAPTWLFEVKPLAPLFLGSAVFVVGVTVLLAARRRWRNGFWLWISYLVVLAPLVGFTEHPHFSSDRYSYLAGVVISAAVTFWMLRAHQEKRPAVLVVAGLILLVFGLRQQSQLQIWENTDTLMARTIAQSGDVDFSADSYRIWAMFHAHQGRLDRAQEILVRAEQFAPSHRLVVRLRRDLSVYESPATIPPDVPGRASAAMFHGQLAVDFSRAGRTAEAREHFLAARRLAPESGTLAFNWATFCAVSGQPELGLHIYLKAANTKTADHPSVPDQVRLLTLIADSFLALKQTTSAIHTAEAALRLAHTSPDAALAERTGEQLMRYRAAAGR
jgi:tetratricopeptide (TPR) repeat protein